MGIPPGGIQVKVGGGAPRDSGSVGSTSGVHHATPPASSPTADQPSVVDLLKSIKRLKLSTTMNSSDQPYKLIFERFGLAVPGLHALILKGNTSFKFELDLVGETIPAKQGEPQKAPGLYLNLINIESHPPITFDVKIAGSADLNQLAAGRKLDASGQYVGSKLERFDLSLNPNLIALPKLPWWVGIPNPCTGPLDVVDILVKLITEAVELYFDKVHKMSANVLDYVVATPGEESAPAAPQMTTVASSAVKTQALTIPFIDWRNIFQEAVVDFYLQAKVDAFPIPLPGASLDIDNMVVELVLDDAIIRPDNHNPSALTLHHFNIAQYYVEAKAPTESGEFISYDYDFSQTDISEQTLRRYGLTARKGKISHQQAIGVESEIRRAMGLGNPRKIDSEAELVQIVAPKQLVEALTNDEGSKQNPYVAFRKKRTVRTYRIRTNKGHEYVWNPFSRQFVETASSRPTPSSRSLTRKIRYNFYHPVAVDIQCTLSPSLTKSFAEFVHPPAKTGQLVRGSQTFNLFSLEESSFIENEENKPLREVLSKIKAGGKIIDAREAEGLLRLVQIAKQRATHALFEIGLNEDSPLTGERLFDGEFGLSDAKLDVIYQKTTDGSWRKAGNADAIDSLPEASALGRYYIPAKTRGYIAWRELKTGGDYAVELMPDVELDVYMANPLQDALPPLNAADAHDVEVGKYYLDLTDTNGNPVFGPLNAFGSLYFSMKAGANSRLAMNDDLTGIYAAGSVSGASARMVLFGGVGKLKLDDVAAGLSSGNADRLTNALDARMTAGPIYMNIRATDILIAMRPLPWDQTGVRDYGGGSYEYYGRVVKINVPSEGAVLDPSKRELFNNLLEQDPALKALWESEENSVPVDRSRPPMNRWQCDVSIALKLFAYSMVSKTFTDTDIAILLRERWARQAPNQHRTSGGDATVLSRVLAVAELGATIVFNFDSDLLTVTYTQDAGGVVRYQGGNDQRDNAINIFLPKGALSIDSQGAKISVDNFNFEIAMGPDSGILIKADFEAWGKVPLPGSSGRMDPKEIKTGLNLDLRTESYGPDGKAAQVPAGVLYRLILGLFGGDPSVKTIEVSPPDRPMTLRADLRIRTEKGRNQRASGESRVELITGEENPAAKESSFKTTWDASFTAPSLIQLFLGKEVALASALRTNFVHVDEVGKTISTEEGRLDFSSFMTIKQHETQGTTIGGSFVPDLIVEIDGPRLAFQMQTDTKFREGYQTLLMAILNRIHYEEAGELINRMNQIVPDIGTMRTKAYIVVGDKESAADVTRSVKDALELLKKGEIPRDFLSQTTLRFNVARAELDPGSVIDEATVGQETRVRDVRLNKR